MEIKQLILLFGLIAVFVFMYVMHIGTSCPVRSYATERAEEQIAKESVAETE